jgi:hypothetical protein
MGLLAARRAAAVPVLMSTGDEAAFTGAYDDYEASLAHVYEPARRTLTSYEGDLVRLRRDSDDAESDFGYDSDGNLDTAAISAWLGGSDGYGVTFYDQAGDDDVTQSTKAAQSLYVASMQNGHPGFRFDGNSDYMQGAFTNGGALSQPFNVFAAAKLDAAAVNDGNYHTITGGDDDSNRLNVRQNITTNPDTWGVNQLITDTETDGNWHLFSFLADDPDSELYLDTSLIKTNNSGVGLDGLTVGADRNGNQLWDGDIAIPAIIADPALSSADRAALESSINAYWSIY